MKPEDPPETVDPAPPVSSDEWGLPLPIVPLASTATDPELGVTTTDPGEEDW